MSETKQYRLSAIWMHDHLDSWNEEEFGTVPDGTYRGRFWVGDLTHVQAEEIVSRASYYATMTGDDRRDNRQYVDAATRVLKTLGAIRYRHTGVTMHRLP